MAKRVDPDITGEVLRPGDVEQLESAVFEIARMARDTGWMSSRTFANLDVIPKRRYTGKISALRRPVELMSTHKPLFTIYEDVFRSHQKEFIEILQGPLDEEEARRIAITYSAASAVGEFALRSNIVDPAFARSFGRTALISALFTDRTDFTNHFEERIPHENLNKLMSAVDDSALVQINGIRAGLTIARSATQEATGTDFMSDDLVLACNAALEQYVGEVGPAYVGLSDYLNVDPTINGVGAFTYAVPEWLYALAIPLPSERLAKIFDERFINHMGEPDKDWSPSRGI